jgi:hypothetical protein
LGLIRDRMACDHGVVVGLGRGVLLIMNARSRTALATLAPLFQVRTLIKILCRLVHAPRAPPCVLDWTDRMTSAEEDLLKAVVITVINDRSTVSADEIAILIAPRLFLGSMGNLFNKFPPDSAL